VWSAVALIEDPSGERTSVDLPRRYSYTIPTEGGLRSINHLVTLSMACQLQLVFFNEYRLRRCAIYLSNKMLLRSDIFNLNKKKYINLLITISTLIEVHSKKYLISFIEL